ncbi:conserved hypothetical protein (plasmid) [Borreliella burgdorferi 118a]|uniref:Uncharacterized protein n=1 Tax=Borreliella burgdorferi 118a TaxID=476210 RepID=A0A7U4DIN5_BORBG|nr:conserved hypothetical protein [Borreliella burgdorferi 118a]
MQYCFCKKSTVKNLKLISEVKNVNYKKVFLARNSILHIKISKAN